MYPRTNYEMTEEDLATLLASCRSMPMMMVGGSFSSTPQENANRAWMALGEKMGFDHMTVRPIDGKGQRFFSAVPSETPEQRTERETHEAKEKRQAEINRLGDEIAERQQRLANLLLDGASHE